MNPLRRLSGSTGIGTIARVTALGLSIALMGGCENSDSDQQPVKPAEVTETARAVKESAQAARALIHLNNDTSVPAVDPGSVDPSVVGGGDDSGIIGSILEAIFDAL